MSFVDQVKSINQRTALVVSLFFVGLIAPGVMTLYLFKPELFTAIETTKLLVLSAAITAPGIFGPFFISVIGVRVFSTLRPEIAHKLGAHIDWYGVHTITNAFNFYLVLWFSYLLHLQFRTFLICISVLVIVSMLAEFGRLVTMAKSKAVQPSLFNE